MPSRFDASLAAPTPRAATGRIGSLLLSLVLRGAMRRIAVFA